MRHESEIRVAEQVIVLPEGHGEPNSHEHEGGPLVLWSEAGQNIIPYLQNQPEKHKVFHSKTQETDKTPRLTHSAVASQELFPQKLMDKGIKM